MKIDKLVRDLIPQIIENQGKIAIIEKVSGEKLLHRLKDKLQEEINEFIADEAVEELADIMEVIYAICAFKHISLEQLEQFRLFKAKKHGTFECGVILKEVLER